MSKPIIEVKNLSKKYNITHQRSYLALRDTLAAALKKPFEIFRPRKRGNPLKEDFWALDEVSFEVKPGEVIGIIGRNGAGKTTLLKILSRITYPTGGEVRLKGRVGSLLEVGTGFHAELTGRENIYFNGAILGMKKKEIDRKFDEIVDFSGVEKFLDTPVKRFSSGMQVRLAFSVAAHLDPEIILVDEVLSVGDAQFQAKCLGKMKDISRGGRTVLFVSHNMPAICNLCPRTLMLESGKIIMDGATNAVVTKYLQENLSTGAFIAGKDLQAKVEGAINKSEPTVRFRDIALLNEKGEFTSTFNSDEPVKIRISYECLKEATDLRINLFIVDEENKRILASQNIDDRRELDSYRRSPGIYESTCVIPPYIFGEKQFFISVHLEHARVEHLVVDRVLGFKVSFQGLNGATTYLRDAFIRPALEWNTKTITKQAKEYSDEQ